MYRLLPLLLLACLGGVSGQALAEATTWQNGHWFEGEGFEIRTMHAENGVFYAKMQSAISIDYPEHRLNRPDSVDVSRVFAPITGPGGHPMRIREVFF